MDILSKGNNHFLSLSQDEVDFVCLLVAKSSGDNDVALAMYEELLKICSPRDTDLGTVCGNMRASESRYKIGIEITQTRTK